MIENLVLNKKITIVIRRDDEWLVECLDKIVNQKKKFGKNTSFSFELIRLAKVGLLGEMGEDNEERKAEAELDKSILRSGDDSSKGAP